MGHKAFNARPQARAVPVISAHPLRHDSPCSTTAEPTATLEVLACIALSSQSVRPKSTYCSTPTSAASS